MKYNQGYNDGRLSATRLFNPIHNNFQRNRSGKIVHFDKEYLKGYKEGFLNNSNGIIPWCF